MIYDCGMAKMNWERVKTESRNLRADTQTRNYLNAKKSANRAARKKLYGWWMKFNNEWFVALDSAYQIGPERIAQVKKSSGEIVDYVVGDAPERTIEYDGGAYSLFKVKRA